jgi:hypothetical protein
MRSCTHERGVWDIALAELPPELHPAIRRYHETRNAANEARGDLAVAKAPLRAL